MVRRRNVKFFFDLNKTYRSPVIILVVILLFYLTSGCLLSPLVDQAVHVNNTQTTITPVTEHHTPVPCDILIGFLPRPPDHWRIDEINVARSNGTFQTYWIYQECTRLKSYVYASWKNEERGSVAVSITDGGSYGIYERLSPYLQKTMVKGYPGYLENVPPPSTKTPHYFKGIIIKDRITVIVSSADMGNIDYFINLTDFEGIGALV